MEHILDNAASAPIDVDMNNFVAEVIEGSSKKPVIAQFWAPWCGPCKQLGPLLEKVVAAANGKVKMVRVNIDNNQQIAQQLRVQSVPTVYAFVDGQPIDGFSGAQPESTLTQFVEKISALGGAGADIATMLEAGNAAAETQAVGSASAAAIASADSSAAAAAGGPSVVPRLALGAAALGRGRASTSEDASPATLDSTSGPTFGAPPRAASSFEIAPLEELVRRASTPRGVLRSPRSSTRSSQPAPASAAYQSPRAAYKSPRAPQPMSQFECLSVKERMKRFQG